MQTRHILFTYMAGQVTTMCLDVLFLSAKSSLKYVL